MGAGHGKSGKLTGKYQRDQIMSCVRKAAYMG